MLQPAPVRTSREPDRTPRLLVVDDPLPVRASASERTRLAVKTRAGCWVRLDCDDILRISAANKYCCLLTLGGSHMVRQPLRELSARLDDRFLRVHRSDIVNLQAVVRVEPWDHGDALLQLSDGSSLVLTRTFRRAFLARFASR